MLYQLAVSGINSKMGNDRERVKTIKLSVPKSMQPAFDGIEPLITDFCNQYLNDEYRELCLHLLEKLCRKRPSPLLAGRKNTWAAAIIYAM